MGRRNFVCVRNEDVADYLFYEKKVEIIDIVVDPNYGIVGWIFFRNDEFYQAVDEYMNTKNKDEELSYEYKKYKNRSNI